MTAPDPTTGTEQGGGQSAESDAPCVICRRPEVEHRDQNGHGFILSKDDPTPKCRIEDRACVDLLRCGDDNCVRVLSLPKTCVTPLAVCGVTFQHESHGYLDDDGRTRVCDGGADR